MNKINTVTIGEVLEFFPETQTVTVKLHIGDVVSTEKSNYNNREIAVLVDVPVHFPKFAGFRITGPVTIGDQCIILFAQSGISHWLYEGRKEYKFTEGRPEIAAAREYDLTDAIAIMGLSNYTNPITSFNETDLEFRNIDNTQRVTLKQDGSIEAQTTDTILQMLPDGTTNITSPTAININTPLATFDTDVLIEGKLDVTGISTAADHVSDGISGKDHIHAHGTPNTSPPNA